MSAVSVITLSADGLRTWHCATVPRKAPLRHCWVCMVSVGLLTDVNAYLQLELPQERISRKGMREGLILEYTLGCSACGGAAPIDARVATHPGLQVNWAMVICTQPSAGQLPMSFPFKKYLTCISVPTKGLVGERDAYESLQSTLRSMPKVFARPSHLRTGCRDI